ncbi:MAG TPA: type II toxin-antitoxin system RelE/ParE family toxin [Balneolaceae bacterium]|nr:plasmid stabilization protein [Balneola sp.]HBQ58229.1 type II toxin-antitoxin system RelE/ParE family toxin [Balneolaceae bacterium]|tara:strand:+ start:380 stop:694 length:315 start_codon:yes stop_codon:yes gene_type:complete
MKVYLSPLAEYKFEKLLEYLEFEWGNSVKKNYLKLFEQKSDVISEFPYSNPKIQGFDNVLRCVITVQSSFYYRVLDDEIEIITTTDNRQNPEKILSKIKRYFQE